MLSRVVAMPRPKILSSTPAQSETILTATTITFKIALGEHADKVGEIISTERVGDKLVVKAKVRLENPMQPSGNWVVSFE
jgi:hypothetical protein